MKKWIFLFSLLAVTLYPIVHPVAQPPSGAKALFYSGEGPTIKRPGEASEAAPKIEKYMGISYWLELERGGKKSRVTTGYAFRTGDQIRLNFRANRGGYLYLVNIGPTGRSNVLFPHPSIAGGENFIKANQTYSIPSETYIRFAEPPGEELILVMLSSKEMSDVTQFLAQKQTLSEAETERVNTITDTRGAKDLVVETEDAGREPASYVVAPLTPLDKGELIKFTIRLKHGR